MKEEKLLQLLQKKKGYFEAILELSQTEEIEAITEWIASLEQKKVLLSCIEQIDEQLKPFQESLNNISQEITEELDNIRLIIQQILHTDQMNQEKRKNAIQCMIPNRRKID
jgi:hypothetical protein